MRKSRESIEFIYYAAAVVYFLSQNPPYQATDMAVYLRKIGDLFPFDITDEERLQIAKTQVIIAARDLDLIPPWE
jgi:hypothetical protein